MNKIFKEWIFATLAALSFLFILIGSIVQSLSESKKTHLKEVCDSSNPTTNAICHYQHSKRQPKDESPYPKTYFDPLAP